MRRRDFLKGLAGACGVACVGVPAIAAAADPQFIMTIAGGRPDDVDAIEKWAVALAGILVRVKLTGGTWSIQERCDTFVVGSKDGFAVRRRRPGSTDYVVVLAMKDPWNSRSGVDPSNVRDVLWVSGDVEITREECFAACMHTIEYRDCGRIATVCNTQGRFE